MTEPRPDPSPPQRVRVTSSRRRATRHTDRPVADELTEHTELGAIYVSGLMRAQLRLAASLLLAGALVLGALPLLFAFWPETRAMEIGPVPLPWAVLGILIYPVVFAVARFYIRASEKLETAFIDIVNRS